jgi:calcineurin-like phosphoesterase family protein
MDYFTSDLHFDHINTFKHRKNFSSIEEMNNTLFHMFDATKKGDRVFILGDLSFTLEGANLIIDSLCKKKVNVFLIMGNHDINWWNKIEESTYLHKCQTMVVKGTSEFNKIFLSHYPQLIFESSHHGAFQLHGHGHIDTIDRPILDNLEFGKRLNVNCEFFNYSLVTRKEVEEIMKEKPDNIDYVLLHGEDKKRRKLIKGLKKINKIMNKINR